MPTLEATATATPAPTATITATPTALPTIPAEDIGDLVTDDRGNPIQGALVYIPGVGTAVTDENGVFRFTSVRVTGPIAIFVQRTGVEFEESTLVVQPGEFAVVRGARKSFNPLDCPAQDNVGTLDKAAGIARKIFEITTNSTGKLPIRLPGRRTARSVKDRLLLRLAAQFDSYLNASRLVPEVALSCSDPQCQSVSFNSALQVMRKELDNLRRGGLYAGKLRSDSKRLSPARKQSLNRRVRRLNSTAKALLKTLPQSTSSCPS